MRQKVVFSFFGESWVAFSGNVDISYDESGMAMDILLKPRIEVTERMVYKTGHFAIQESRRAQNGVQVTLV